MVKKSDLGLEIIAKPKRELTRKDHLWNHFNSLTEDGKDILRKNEIKKTLFQENMIVLANIETNKLMREAGVKPFNIPEENYHIIPHKLFRKVNPRKAWKASAAREKVGILFNKEDFGARDRINFVLSTFHESTHIKQSPKSSIRIGLEEAIIRNLEKRLLKKVLDRPEFKREREKRESKKTKIWFKGTEIDIDEITNIKKLKNVDNGKRLSFLGYEEQWAVLEYALQEIQKEFPKDYKNIDEVFDEFSKAHFNEENEVKIKELMKRTFGSESAFEVLNNMNPDMTEEERDGTLKILKTLRKESGGEINKKW